MGAFLEVADLAPFATIDGTKAEAMVRDAEALALTAAPCLAGTLTDDQRAAVRALLRTAVLRWHEAGTGALTQQTAGSFGVSYDTRQRRYGGLLESERQQLRSICGAGRGHAFTVDLAVRRPAPYETRPDLRFQGGSP